MQLIKNTYTHINKNESTHSEMGPVRRKLTQRTVRTAHQSVLMTFYFTLWPLAERGVAILSVACFCLSVMEVLA